MKVIAMQASDFPAVQRIQEQAYAAELVESIEVLAAKYRWSPELCFVACVDDVVAGYVIAHGWDRETSPGLHKEYEELPVVEAVHIHDLAVDPAFLGRGVARAILAALEDAARAKSLREMTLVAVAGADSFWTRMGFVVERAAEGYDDVAVFMRRYLEEA